MYYFRYIFTSIVLLSVAFGHGQSPLTQGAEWFYTLRFFGTNDEGFNRCYIEGDTVIQGKHCLIYHQTEINCDQRPIKDHLLVDGDQVSYYDSASSEFRLLYDFSLEVGDTMVIDLGDQFFDRPFYIRIDSTDVFTENAIDLKLFHISYGYEDEQQQIVFHKK